MCHRATCTDCGKPTFRGCGRHIESVLADVSATERCQCRGPGAGGARGATGPGGWRAFLGLLKPGAVEVEAEKERTPARLGRFSMRVHLPAGTSDRQVAGVERAVRSCPAYGTLIQPPTVELSIDVAGTPSEEKVSA
jgi:hypothetical protein